MSQTLTAITPAPRPEIQENNLFPVFLKLDMLRVLLIGAGNVGCEKLRTLVANTDRRNITVVAASVSEPFAAMARESKGIEILQKEFEHTDMDDVDLVISAVGDVQLSALIRDEAHLRGLLFNAADMPDYCDFYLGAVVRKGQLKIAISTNGKSPTVARRLKEVLNAGIPDEIDDLLHAVNKLRQQLGGDFSEKVRKLNVLTEGLVSPAPASAASKERYWKKVAYGCVAILAALFLGNFLARYITVDIALRHLANWYQATPREFYLMLLTGFLAQLVDGALGMGYGVTCTSVLLAVGIPLPAISGGIHTAEMFSSGASGFSHYKFGNVNKKLFRLILLPALVGSFAGAFILSKWGEQYAGSFKPLLALYTLFLGVRILLNAFKKNLAKDRLKNVGWLGFFGGFLDSIGGGGWGPLVTSTLISKGKSPRFVIGTVSLVEFFVTLVSAVTFFIMIGISHWQVITGLIIGGIIAAPLAAKLSGKLPRKAGFISIGLLIILWSLNVIIRML